MFQQFLLYLQQHRWLNVFLVTVYFLLMIVLHHPFVLLSIWVEKVLNIELYNILVAAVFIIFMVLLLYFSTNYFLKTKEHQVIKLFYLFATIAFLIIHSRFMFDSNIEVIHAFGFSLLTILLFPFTKRFGAAILFTLPFMLIDEWYQYIILYPEWLDYFDLNDILTDTYGSALAMVFLLIAGVKGDNNIQPILKRTEFIVIIFFAVITLALVKMCIIVPYSNNACLNTWVVMNERVTPEPFWRPHPTHKIFYHVMNPAEGFIAILTLYFFYFGLDSFRKYK